MTWCLILFIYSTFPQSTVFIKCMEHNQNVGPTKEKRLKHKWKQKQLTIVMSSLCGTIHIHGGGSLYIDMMSLQIHQRVVHFFLITYIIISKQYIKGTIKKSASRTMISYLPIKHILDCKAFLFFNTVYPSLLKCLINKMKPFMALMSHSTKLINKPCQTP